MISYGSVCSGIESASVAWEPLGFTPSWFSEIEPFPCAVLAHRFPTVANLGDMSLLPEAVRWGAIPAPDVLVGGTPCQAFSIAGKQESLADARGGLSLIYGDLLDAIDEQRGEGNETVCLWENVPGVLSTKDNAFGFLLGLLAGEYTLADCLSGAAQPLEPGSRPEAGTSNKFWSWNKTSREHRTKWTKSGCIIGPKRTVAWRVLDAQYFGLAQRRKRVFVVASARDGFDPAAVLFEREGVRRDIAPSRETGQEVAGSVREGVTGSSHHAHTLGRNNGTENCVLAFAENSRAELRFEGGDGSIVGALSTGGGKPGQGIPTVLALQGSMIGRSDSAGPQGSGINSELSFTLNTTDRHAVCFQQNASGELRESELAYTLNTNSNASGRNTGLLREHPPAVRRLTPVECERLQGFPDNWTRIPWRNKPDTPDGPRYKAIGNSKAVPVVQWLGARIAVELLK